MGGVLEGIRVLDFGRYIAGPFCGALLADMGAEVIRIEKIDGSEDRYVGPVGEGEPGAAFLQMCRNKKGLTLNPMKPQGQEILQRLVPTADVVVANLPHPTLKAMGIDYESLKAIKPNIILTMVSAFGIDGPYAERVGFDTLGQAMSGAMYLTGDPGRPTRAQVPYVDFGTALFSAFGTMAALMERNKTGRGQLVESSLFSTALTFANPFHIEQAVLEINREPQGNRGYTAAPVDAFRTRDGWIYVLAIGTPIFERWARLMGEEEWLSDPRFATDDDRGRHGHLISERMQRWCDERTTAEALAELEQARVPGGQVNTVQEALDDPHAAARKLFKMLEYPGVRCPAPVMDTAVRLSATPGNVRHRAPLLGEHTDAILGELGYSAREIAGFRKQRIV
ncbi:MAG: CoA transferase [Candidatus Lambdaproteobacteria bacterium]|nr:CoA transferase [Candidatus Lambdaproteobacteria bacterium]